MLASIIGRSDGVISFRVDDVEPAQEQLALEPATTQFARRCGASLLAISHNESSLLVRADGNHPLVSAVHLAFSQHRPLLLTPDDIWMVIAQGFAYHLNQHAEALRDRFVRHQGRRKIEIETLDLTESQHWADAIDKWSAGISKHVGPGLLRLLVCDFSTTTATIRTASQVVMMDAFQQYFDYHMLCVCGIPQITLFGTPDDWHMLRQRVDVLAEFALEWWTTRLVPICDALIETAGGRPPLQFWRSIYKPEEIYGGEVVTGWLADLFPYINHWITKAPSVKNPILDTPRAALMVDQGIRPDDFPAGLSQAPFTLWVKQKEYPLVLVAGFIGVSQDPVTGQLRPEIGWAVREQDRMRQIIDRIARDHETGGTVDWSRHLWGLPKELIQMLERFDGAALFKQTEHSWRIRRIQTHRDYRIIGSRQSATHFIDLKDGRCVAYVFVYRPAGDDQEELAYQPPEVWVVVGRPMIYVDPRRREKEIVLPLEETIVVAKGMLQFFERLFQAEGRYYFDEPGFVPDDAFTPRS